MNERMKMSPLWFGSIALLLSLFPLAAFAQDTRVQVLERKLQERDKVILELLDRVEALERRVGVEHPAAKSGSAASVDAPERVVAPDSERVSGEEPEDQDAPGRVVVEKGAAERALERSLTREGALLLPRGILEIEPGLRYSRREDSTPRLSLANGQFFVVESERNADSLTADLALRLGMAWDTQLEFGLPYRWREVESVDTVNFAPTGVSGRSGSALGDVRVGLAKTLLREGLWLPDLIGRITWDTDSGEDFDNGVSLGGGFNELRGSLTAIKRQNPIVLVGGLSYEHSFEESRIQPGPIFGANIGSFIALSPESSLHFLVSGAYQGETELLGEEIAGSDRVLATLRIGGSTLLAPGVLLNLSVDAGLTNDADDFAISLSLPFRFNEPLY